VIKMSAETAKTELCGPDVVSVTLALQNGGVIDAVDVVKAYANEVSVKYFRYELSRSEGGEALGSLHELSRAELHRKTLHVRLRLLPLPAAVPPPPPPLTPLPSDGEVGYAAAGAGKGGIVAAAGASKEEVRALIVEGQEALAVRLQRLLLDRLGDDAVSAATPSHYEDPSAASWR